MKTAVALVGANVREALSGTILGSASFDTVFEDDTDQAFQLLLRSKPDLFVIHDLGPGFAAGFLERLVKAYPSAPFPALVLSGRKKEKYPPIVRSTQPVEFDPYTLNRSVALLVGLPTRRSRRLLIRVGVRIGSPSDASILANTVNLSGVGMALQCNRPLKVGGAYQIQFLSTAGQQMPILNLRLVRQLKGRDHRSSLYQYAGAFEGIDQQQMEQLIRDVFFEE
jgi:hypothetical protein